MSSLGRALPRSADLALAAASVGALVALMLVGGAHPLLAAARLAVGLAFVLFVPGYCLLAALLPRAGALDRAERIGVSIGASIALIPVLALLLDRLPWGLRPWPIVLAEGALTLALAATALWQRAHVSQEDPGHRAGGPAIRGWLRQLSPSERVAYPLVLAVAIVATLYALRLVVTPTSQDLMTELYVLGRGGLAEQFPRAVEVGQPVSVTLGLVNRELSERTYRVEAWTRDAWSADPGTQLVPPLSVSVAPRERIEWPMTWQMTRPGDDQAIDVLVFVDGEAEPYRRVRLWLDVLPPATAGGARPARPDAPAPDEGIEADLSPGGRPRPTPVPPPTEHLPPSVPAPVAAGLVPPSVPAAAAEPPPERRRLPEAIPAPTALAAAHGPDDGAATHANAAAHANAATHGDAAAPSDPEAASGRPDDGAPPGPPPGPATSGGPSDAGAAAGEPSALHSRAPTPDDSSVAPGEPGRSAVVLPTPGASATFQHDGGSAGAARAQAGFRPWWVKNHRLGELDPQPPGGPDGVVALASTQFCSFLVVQPQASDELQVLNPYTGQLVWIPADDVGPVEGPVLGRGAPPAGRTCTEAIYPETRVLIDAAGDAVAGWARHPAATAADVDGLVLRVPPSGGPALAVAPVPHAVDDVIVTATLRLPGSDAGGRYGVCARAAPSGPGGGAVERQLAC